MSGVRLGEIAAVIAQLVDPRLPEYRTLPLVNGENIESGTGRLTYERTAEDESAISPKYLFEPGDVLYSKLRPYLRKVVVAEKQGLCSADMYPIHVNRDQVDSDWMKWHLLGRQFTEYAVRESARARMPKLNRDQLLAYRLSLPPLAEQRRIAARLREQLAEIGRVASAAQARIDQMNSLAQRVIDAAIPASDTIALAHTLRTPLRTGLSRAASATANHRVLTLSSVRIGVLDVGQNRPMDATGDEAFANAVRPSTFYVVRGNGSLHMAGAGALSPESSEGVVLYPDLLIQVDPDPALLSVEYLALAWRSHRVRHQVETRLRTSAGIHKINLANLSTVEVPTPPIAEQRRIATRLREQLAEIDRAKASLEAQGAAVEALPTALLWEAFADVAVIGPRT